jgi:hypothetical protein
MSKNYVQTREAKCRVCGASFVAKRCGPSDLWSEVCKTRACRGYGLFNAKTRVIPRRDRVYSNDIDGGGRNGRYRRDVTFADPWN